MYYEDRRPYAGAPLKVEIAQGGRVATSSRGPPTRTEHRIRVANLPPGTSWQDLKDFVRVAGEPGYATVIDEGSRGSFGIVEFVRDDDARYAVRKLDNTEMANRRGDRSVVRIDPETGFGPSSSSSSSGGRRNGGGGGGRNYDRGDDRRERDREPNRDRDSHKEARRSRSRSGSRGRRDDAYASHASHDPHASDLHAAEAPTGEYDAAATAAPGEDQH